MLPVLAADLGVGCAVLAEPVDTDCPEVLGLYHFGAMLAAADPVVGRVFRGLRLCHFSSSLLHYYSRLHKQRQEKSAKPRPFNSWTTSATRYGWRIEATGESKPWPLPRASVPQSIRLTEPSAQMATYSLFRLSSRFSPLLSRAASVEMRLISIMLLPPVYFVVRCAACWMRIVGDVAMSAFAVFGIGQGKAIGLVPVQIGLYHLARRFVDYLCALHT